MTTSTIFLAFAALAFLVGIGGSFLIARKLSGVAAVAAFLVWLAAPFVVLFVSFSLSVDPTLAPERASYNVAMATVLTSFVIAIPWFVANLIGGLMGRRRPYGGKMPAPTPGMAIPPADFDLPDWRHYDQPSLSLDQLGALMHEIAARAGIDERLLPHVGPLGGADGEHLERDKFDYIYIGVENGVTVFDHREVIADKTMYKVFGNIARKLAVRRLALPGVPEADYADGVAAEQQAILTAIDRRWGRQFEVDSAHAAGA